MMGFLDVAVKNARLTVTALIFFLIAGAVAYVNIPKEAEPDIQFPVIYVSHVAAGHLARGRGTVAGATGRDADQERSRASTRSRRVPTRAAAMS
jgi:hypothetical protein